MVLRATTEGARHDGSGESTRRALLKYTFKTKRRQRGRTTNGGPKYIACPSTQMRTQHVPNCLDPTFPCSLPPGAFLTAPHTLYTVPSLNMISFLSCILSAALLASLLPNISSVPNPSFTIGTRSAKSTIPSAPSEVVKT